MHDTTLPPEILENVVDFCSPDKSTLRALSLASTTCLFLARKQLFADIALHPPDLNAFIRGSNIFRIVNTRLTMPGGLIGVDSPSSKLLAIIKDPEQRRSRLGSVAPFVRHLHLCEGSGMTCWIAADSSLPPLLRELSNLLSFRFSHSGPMPVSWFEIPLTLQEAIGAFVLSQPTLIEIRLSGLVFQSMKQVKSLLGLCKGLRTLEIDHSGVQEVGEMEAGGGGGVGRTTLDTLILGRLTPTLFVRSLLQPSFPLRVDMIRKLCLSIPGDFAEFQALLHASPSLETLELVLTTQLDVQKYWTLPPSEQVDLSKVPSLCNFRITFDVLQKMDDLLEWLAALLRTGVDRNFPTRPNMIRNLSVVFTLFVPGLRIDYLTDAMLFIGWRNVDAVLCGDERREERSHTHAYSNLRRVKLVFILKKPVNLTLAPRFLNELVLDSPGLRERELLIVDAVDGWNLRE